MKRFRSGDPATTGEPVEPELAQPYEILDPEQLTTPLILSSPHSGRIYPARFVAASRLTAQALRKSEDAFVDDLFAPAVALGAPMLRAHFPRAYLDANREPYELDPRMFDGKLPAFANTRSLRVAGGLGTIARVVGESQDIYARRMPVEEALRRIEGLYKPFHSALRGLMRRAAGRFGLAVLIDCHSMPSWTSASAKPERMGADIILGDRYGTSCHPALIDVAEKHLRMLGYHVQRNKPYAGGFITEHYGSPGAGFHALQIEINRGLYMEEETLARRPAFAQVSMDLRDVVESLMKTAADIGGDRSGGTLPLAAE
ncbi:MAG: N-formylglutamate amidohydrolase [Hyphomicrobiales bacterium]|nr:N-formylglutamate amidohydrolase [Hyphomicrobiales bacterium]